MSRIEKLKKKIDTLYQAKYPHRADWADWLYKNHIFVVAGYAEQLADRFHANKEWAMAAGMLHDIADAVMARENPQHEAESLAIARRLLKESDFAEEEIKTIVDDAIRFHSCHGDDVPETIEGKVMATADAFAHLSTDFYDHALELFQKESSMEEIRSWALPKIERDYRKKIFFNEVREETVGDYERIKRLFTT